MATPHIIAEKTLPVIRTDSTFYQQGPLSRALPPSRLKAYETTATKWLDPASFNEQNPPQSSEDLEKYLTTAFHANKKDSSQVFVVEQRNSRRNLDTTSGDLKSLLDRIDAFPGLGKVIKAFERDGSDSYVGKAGAHFSPAVEDSKGESINHHSHRPL
jgi:hypothetical protein